MIAESFVVGDRQDAHWDESAKSLFQALFIYAAQENKSIDSIRDIICLSGDVFLDALGPMARSTSPVVKRCVSSYLGKERKELSGILSTAQRHTAILDEEKVAGVLNRNGFSLGNIKKTETDIFIVIPPERVATYGRYIRLIVSLCITAVTRVKGSRPVLFLLDEICQIGRLDIIENAVSLMRGYEAFLWLIVQDLGQLKGVYGEKSSSFIANSIGQYFGTSDYETAKYLSNTMGNKTVIYSIAGTGGIGTDNESESESESVTQRALMTPDEIMSMNSDEVLIFEQSKRPARVWKLNYLEQPIYKGLASVNPMHES